jgi:hypothetical protein
VYALVVVGSNLYVGGYFTTAGGNQALSIAKWDGTIWTPVGSGVNGEIMALAAHGGDLYAAGSFELVDGIPANSIAKWDGAVWTPLGSGLNSEVKALAAVGNDLYAGGLFTTAGANVSAYIARAYMPPLPVLSVLRSRPNMTLSWLSSYTPEFTLEQADFVAAPANWISNTDSITDDGTNKSITISATNGSRFFRLGRP